MTDHFTDELFAGSSGTARVVYPVSRLVVDPERFVDDAQETMVSRGMGVIYTKTDWWRAASRAFSRYAHRVAPSIL